MAEPKQVRLFAVSDIHVDYADNMAWCKSLSQTDYQQDALIVAGDVTHKMEQLEETLSIFKSKFKNVFFVPGNHDLWVMKDESFANSIEKFDVIMNLCKKLGVHTKPEKIGLNEFLWVVPMFSWYSENFDPDKSTFGEKIVGWGDFYLCKWPDEALNKEPRTLSSPQGTPEDYFLSKNNEAIGRTYDSPVLTFSHFLPRPECMPRKEILMLKILPKVAGTIKLDQQIRSIGSKIHVFGHTHINWNKTYDGVRYVQNAIKYPKERALLGSHYGNTDLEKMKVWEG